jgi:hypothetical protein
MNRAHVAVFLAALTDDDTGALTTSDGSVPQGTRPPYRVVYASVTTPEAHGMEDAADAVVCTAIVHNVGVNADAARTIADRTAAALIGLRPVITGRDCERIKLIDSVPASGGSRGSGSDVSRDESTLVTVIDHIDVYRFTSLPG